MQFRTWHLLTATALAAFLFAILILWLRNHSSPTNWNYIVSGAGDAGVNGYIFVDEKNEVRVVVLEKLTRDSEVRKRTRNYKPDWLDFSMSRDGRMQINVDGRDVPFGDTIEVYYGVDGEHPKKLTAPANAVVPHEFPHLMWSRLVGNNMDEQ